MRGVNWKSGVRESNPCKSAWKADAQPLGQPRTRSNTTATIVRNRGERGQFRDRTSFFAARPGHVNKWPSRNDRERSSPLIIDENLSSRSYKNLI